MSSTLKKERIVYFTGIALFVILAICLCFPYITWGVYTNNQIVTVADSVTYLGWQLFGLTAYYRGDTMITESGEISSGLLTAHSIAPLGTEAMFVIFNYCLLFIALAIAIIDGFALFKSYVHGTSFGQKFINILHIGFAVIAMALIVVYIPYVNHLNTYEFTSTNNADVAAQAKAWSSFAFKSLTGVETQMAATPFIIAALGLAAALTCIIVTMKLQDNSILYPYKKRHIIAATVCLVVCAAVYFLPNIDFYFSTYFIYERGNDNLMTMLFQNRPNNVASAILNANALERIAQNFSTGVGWDCILSGSGDIAGFYKVVFSFMFVVAGAGILLSLANLLAAVGVIRFNFDKKYLSMVTLIIMIMSILLWAASFVYSIGVNIRLDSNFNVKDYYQYYLKAYPNGHFPQPLCTVGAWLSMLPGIAGFVGTKVLCAYDD